MRVNEERYEKVLAAIEDLAMAGKDYTFDKFCTEKKLYSAMDKHRIGGTFIVCPFHGDQDPSLSIDEAGRRFKCFGCGIGGKYIHFITEYDRKVLGLPMSRELKVNELLNQDKVLQAKVGFSSIFQSDVMHVSQLEKIEFKKFKFSKKPSSSYLELASLMQKKKCDLQLIKYALILMQEGLAPEIIEQQILNFKPSATRKTYSIEELEQE